MKLPPVAIVILTYNGFELVKECLEAFSKVTYSYKKIFLVDNHSTKEGEIAKLQTLSEYYDYLVEIPHRNRGFSGGINFGARYALEKGDFKYILLHTNDVIPKEDFLDELVKALEKDEKIGIAGSVQYHYNEEKKLQDIYFAGATNTLITNKIRHIRRMTDKPEVYFVNASTFIIRKDCFLQTNGFDEIYYSWYEDCDLAVRARKLGWKLALVKDSIVWHKIGQTVGPHTVELILHSIFYHSRNRVLFVKKCKPRIEYYAFLFYLLVIEPLIFIMRKTITACRSPRNMISDFRNQGLREMGLKSLNAYCGGVYNALFSKRYLESLETIPATTRIKSEQQSGSDIA